MYCPNCGHENQDTNKFCLNCGARLAVAAPEPPPQPSPQPPPGPTPGPAPQPTPGPTPAPVGGGLLSDARVRWGIIGLGGLLLLVVGFVVGSFLLRALLGLRGGDEILLSMPQRNGEYDLHLLEMGDTLDEGRVLFEDVMPASQVFVTYRVDPSTTKALSRSFGGFVPDGSSILLHYLDDEDAVLQMMNIGDEDAVEVFKSNAFPISGIVHDSGHFFVSETRNNTNRCYVGTNSERVRRVGRGTQCSLTLDGERIILSDVDSGETTLSIVDKNGENEILVLDEVDDVLSHRVSYDGAAVAYVEESGSFEQQIHVIDVNARSAEPYGGEHFHVHQYGFLSQSSTPYALVENDDGQLLLYIGERSEAVATAEMLEMQVGADDRRVYYMTGDDDGERSVFVYDVGSETSTEVVTDDFLSFGYVREADRLFIRQNDGDEVRILSARADGSDMVEIFEGDRLNQAFMYYTESGNHVFVLIENERGEASLYATPNDRAEGFYVLEEWDEIMPLNITSDGQRMLLAAVEDQGDRPVLFVTELDADATPVELDDDGDEYLNAVFAPNGRTVLFTARTGSSVDDVEVMQVRSDGSEPAERLYDEAILSDVRWAELNPFRFMPVRGARGPVSFCPGATSIAVGDSRQGVVPPNGEACYRLRALAGEMLAFELERPSNESSSFALTLYRRDGDQVMSSGMRNSPFMSINAPAADIYYLRVTSASSSSARFTLQMIQP